MARYKCPSCGASYNGKLCRSCSYENFSNETSCSVHHKEIVFDDGENLGTAPRKHSDFSKQHPEWIPDEVPASQAGKKNPRSFRLIANTILVSIVFLIAASGIVSLLFGTTRTIVIEPEPETVFLPGEETVLYDTDGLTIKAGWQDGQEYIGDIPIVAENNTDRDLGISVLELVVNGYMMDLSYLYCRPMAGTTYYGALRLDEDDLKSTGIETVQEISFRLDVYDAETYDTIAETDTIILRADAPEGFTQPPIEDGAVIWEGEGVSIRFLGYRPDSYHTEDFLEGDFQFYIENNSPRTLDLYTIDSLVNGETAELNLWCQLLPGTRAVGRVYLYYLEDMGIDSLDDIQSLGLQLELGDPNDWSYAIQTDMITMPLTE